mmetsp:Transcript_79509/g.133180  ORF Transcript_79509/g.133180 Transcript_79509/m.133180 type:complete len:223 (+) Transcript_79509:1133-1801(+)
MQQVHDKLRNLEQALSLRLRRFPLLRFCFLLRWLLLFAIRSHLLWLRHFQIFGPQFEQQLHQSVRLFAAADSVTIQRAFGANAGLQHGVQPHVGIANGQPRKNRANQPREVHQQLEAVALVRHASRCNEVLHGSHVVGTADFLQIFLQRSSRTALAQQQSRALHRSIGNGHRQHVNLHIVMLRLLLVLRAPSVLLVLVLVTALPILLIDSFCTVLTLRLQLR